METSKTSLKTILLIAASMIASFVAGAKYRSTRSAVDEARETGRIESVEFDPVTTVSTYEKSRTGRVVSFYTTSEGGVHDKIFQQESPNQGTFVSVPGRVNGTDIRIVIVIDPND